MKVRLALPIAAVAATGLFLSNSALALAPGDTVEFLRPADGLQPEPPATRLDKLIYTGGKMFYPAGTLVVITSSVLDAVHPGTRFRDLTAAGTCSIAGKVFNRYQGTVD